MTPRGESHLVSLFAPFSPRFIRYPSSSPYLSSFLLLGGQDDSGDASPDGVLYDAESGDFLQEFIYLQEPNFVVCC